MPKHTRSIRSTAAAVVLALALAPAASAAGDEGRSFLPKLPENAKAQLATIEKGFGIGFDAVVLRPLRAATLVVGWVAFMPAAILTAPGGRPALEAAADVLIETPYKNLVEPELGDF